ncbi:MAG: hypothetical protein L0387_23605 [Acidobacteria bacterium]|nr:hypothetical protein [Acidobacteriota bacterium]MCI0722827.1 hypothetical protein [Acidobacteriota bacterium]
MIQNLKTVELIVEDWPWRPRLRRRTDERVLLKVVFFDRALRQQVKEAGGVWN